MNLLLNPIKETVAKELKYLSSLYPYNAEKFLDKRLLHSQSLLSFLDTGLVLSKNLLKKLINLLSGIELLAAGLNFHRYSAEDFEFIEKIIPGISPLAGNSCGDKKEKPSFSPCKNNNDAFNLYQGKRYTIDLLFGDIFYSRAVAYILKYGDHDIFKSILESLKTVHLNKLLLRGHIISSIKRSKIKLKFKEGLKQDISVKEKGMLYEEQIQALVQDNQDLITGINSLIKNSFFLGFKLLSGQKDFYFPSKIVSDFVLYKTMADLELFYTAMKKRYSLPGRTSFIKISKNQIRTRLQKEISGISLCRLNENFNRLLYLYSKDAF